MHLMMSFHITVLIEHSKLLNSEFSSLQAVNSVCAVVVCLDLVWLCSLAMGLIVAALQDAKLAEAEALHDKESVKARSGGEGQDSAMAASF